MITKSDWIQPEERAYFHQISSDCISKLSAVVTSLSEGNMDVETSFRMYEKILREEINDPEFLSFAIGNINELSSYVAKGKVNIRIHRNDVDVLWLEADDKNEP